MKKLFAAFLALAVLLILAGTAFADPGSEVESEADLDGSQEVPPVVTAMFGEVEVEIDDGELEFELEVEGNTHDISAAHIHCAPPGSNGPVGVTLFLGSFTAADGTLAEGTIVVPDSGNGCGWADIAAVAAAIQSGNTYVNVHTTTASGGTPSGEIRGNLPVDDDDDDADVPPGMVLDDFNTGAVNLTATSFTGSVAATVPGGTRYLRLSDSLPATVPSTMTLTPGDGYMDLSVGDNSGSYFISYGGFDPLGPTSVNLDATTNGADSFQVTISEAAGSAGSIQIAACTDGLGAFGCDISNVSVSTLAFAGPGTYTFLFSGFSGAVHVDFSDVDWMHIGLFGGIAENTVHRFEEFRTSGP